MAERLYYNNSYLRQFEATCVGLAEGPKGFEVILDQTAFYPTSGGQPHDLGMIEDSPIQDVFENEEGEIVHSVGKAIETHVPKCSIDWARRFDHMQQHTGQHILSQAFVRACRMDTVGFHMGRTCATIDLNGQSLTSDQLQQAEDLANNIVRENRLVKVRVVSPEEVPSLGLRKESRREGPLRIVEIDDFDVSACGGTHVKQSSEVGEIVVRKVERVNRQTRIEFVCGQRALESHRAALSSLDAIANKFSVGRAETVERVERQIEEARQLRKLLQEKNKSLALFVAEESYAQAPERHGIKLVKRLFKNEDLDFLKLIAQRLVSRGLCVVLLGNQGTQAQLVFAQTEAIKLDLRRFLDECCLLIDGKGGGTATLVQGGGKRSDQLQAALDVAEKHVIVALSQRPS